MNFWEMLYWAAMGILVAEIRRNDPLTKLNYREKFLEIHGQTGYIGGRGGSEGQVLFDIYEIYKAKGMH